MIGARLARTCIIRLYRVGASYFRLLIQQRRILAEALQHKLASSGAPHCHF